MITALTCVLFALHREARPFLRLLPPTRKVIDTPVPTWHWDKPRPLLVLETGMGAENTRRALEWIEANVTSEEQARTVISAGFAGALAPTLKAGDVVTPEQVVEQDGTAWPTTAQLFTSDALKVIHVVRSLHVDRIIASTQEKAQLHADSAADFVDMESAIVGRWCHERGWAFGCLRAISDSAGTSLSPELARWINRERASPGAVLRSLIRSPLLIMEALRLATNTRRAANALAVALWQSIGCRSGIWE